MLISQKIVEYFLLMNHSVSNEMHLLVFFSIIVML